MNTVYVSTVISVNESHFIGVFDIFLRFFALKFSSSLASSKSLKASGVFGYLKKTHLSNQTWIVIGLISDLLASNWWSALFLQHWFGSYYAIGNHDN